MPRLAVIGGPEKPQRYGLSALSCIIEQAVQAAVCLLAALKTVLWGNISVSGVKSGLEVGAFSYVSYFVFSGEKIDSTRLDAVWKLEAAKWARAVAVSVKRQISRIFVAMQWHEQAQGPVFVSQRLDVANGLEVVTAELTLLIFIVSLLFFFFAPAQAPLRAPQ